MSELSLSLLESSLEFITILSTILSNMPSKSHIFFSYETTRLTQLCHSSAVTIWNAVYTWLAYPSRLRPRLSNSLHECRRYPRFTPLRHLKFEFRKMQKLLLGICMKNVLGARWRKRQGASLWAGRPGFDPGCRRAGDFSSLLRVQTGPGVHSTSYKMSTGEFLRG